MNCVSLSDTARSCAVVAAQCSAYRAGVVQHIKCLLFSFSLSQVILYTRLCVPDLRHCMHHDSRKSHVSISSRMVAEPVFDHGSTIGCFGELSKADGGSYGTTRSMVC